MRSVLISIQPKWCELIASGKKTVEVRKSKPKLKTPFKVYIYCTKDFKPNVKYGFKLWAGRGKVIGEFVCDYIFEIKTEYEIHTELPGNPVETWHSWEDAPEEYLEDADIEKATCLSFGDIKCYMWNSPGCFCWHISNLVIYDQPKDLGAFTKPYGTIVRAFDSPYIQRPPQSWRYVEELECQR